MLFVDGCAKAAWIAVLGLAVSVATMAADAPEAEAGRGAPVIEVAAFAVGPVVPYGIQAEAAPTETNRRFETRLLPGERWGALLQRAAAALSAPWMDEPDLLRHVALMPDPVPGRYVALRDDRARGGVELDYVLRESEAYEIYLHPTAFELRKRESDPRLVEKLRSDVSKATLFSATDAMGLPEELVLQLTEIFSHEIDFHRDLHQGYVCSLVYEVSYRNGHIERTGRILAARFDLPGRAVYGFHFEDGTGRAGYFSESGKSLRKVFRQSPVPFSRVTSGYTAARFHPVLGIWRAHKGTDYAAPLGTPVVATADGMVQHRGPQGSFGNLVVLLHERGYATYYAHLHGFAPDLALASRVRKGQTIGYVGMTGLATGPHLHYEFRVRDVKGQWNSVPPPDLVEEPAVTSDDYFQTVRSYRTKLQFARENQLVLLD